MKKALLCTTALIAASAIGAMTAGPASAEEKIKLRLGGYMEQWFGYTDQDLAGDFDGFQALDDSEVFFLGKTTLDNGITFGVNIQLEGNTNTGDQIDESFLYISGDFGRVQIGSENSAQYQMQYSAPDVGIGANSGDQTAWASGLSGSYFRTPFGSTFVEANGVNDVFRVTYYTPRFSGFQFGASYAPANQGNAQDFGSFDRDLALHDGISLGANLVESFNGIDVAVAGGYGRWEAASGTEDPEVWNAGLSLGFSGFTVGGSVAVSDNDSNVGDATAWDVGVSYATGPWGVSVIYFTGERDGGSLDNVEHETVHGSVSYVMGPGIKFVGTLGYTEVDDKSAANVDNEALYFVVGPKLSF